MPDLIDFLRLIHGNDPGWIELRAIPEPREEGRYTRSVFVTDPQQAISWASSEGRRLNNKTHGLFFGVVRRFRRPESAFKSGCDADVVALRCLYADLDWKGYTGGQDEAKERLMNVSPAPTAVVCSGGGWHAYWRLRQQIAPDVSRKLNRQLALALGSDTTVCNPSRVLRLPGSLHRKHADNIRPVTIVGFHPDLLYDEGNFSRLPVLPIQAIPTARPMPKGQCGTRYAQAVLVKSCDRISHMLDGQKHYELFKAAARLGEFIGAGLIDRLTCQSWLLHAVVQAGARDLKAAEKTITDAFAKGERNPVPLEK